MNFSQKSGRHELILKLNSSNIVPVLAICMNENYIARVKAYTFMPNLPNRPVCQQSCLFLPSLVTVYILDSSYSGE